MSDNIVAYWCKMYSLLYILYIYMCVCVCFFALLQYKGKEMVRKAKLSM